MAQFCPSCGHEQENPNNAFCSKCGAALNNAQQQVQQPMNAGMNMAPQKSYTAVLVIGYIVATVGTWILSFIGTIITIAIGAYIYTRDDNPDVRKHGLIMIAISVIIMIIQFIALYMLMSSSYYYY